MVYNGLKVVKLNFYFLKEYFIFFLGIISLLFGSEILGYKVYFITVPVGILVLLFLLKKKLTLPIIYILILNLLFDPSIVRVNLSILTLIFYSYFTIGQNLSKKQITILIILQIFLFIVEVLNINQSLINFPTPVSAYGIDLIGLQFGNPNNLGYFFLLSLCVLIKNKNHALLPIIILGSIILIGSRGILILSLILLTLYFFKNNLKLFFLALGALIFSIQSFSLEDFENYTYLFNKYSSFIDFTATSIGRIDYINEWARFDWLPFGKKMGSKYATAPHNLVIELSFLLGAGFLFLLILLKRKIKFDWRLIVVLLGSSIPSTLIAFPVYGLFFGYLFKNNEITN